MSIEIHRLFDRLAGLSMEGVPRVAVPLPIAAEIERLQRRSAALEIAEKTLIRAHDVFVDQGYSYAADWTAEALTAIAAEKAGEQEEVRG